MSTDRKRGVAVGVLFITAMVSYLAGSTIIGGQPVAGALLEVVNSAAVLTIGVLMYQILRRFNLVAAGLYAGARTLEAVLLVIAIPTVFTAIAGGVAFGADDLFQIAMIILALGSLPMLAVLYKTKLVPRWITVVGFVTYVSLFVSAVLTVFGVSFTGIEALYAPGVLFEVLLFPPYLIFKGFNLPKTEKVS